MVKRATRAGALVVGGAAVVGAGGALFDHASWLAWPMVVGGTMAMTAGVIWFVAAPAVPYVVRPLAKAIVSELDHARLIEPLAEEIREAAKPIQMVESLGPVSDAGRRENRKHIANELIAILEGHRLHLTPDRIDYLDLDEEGPWDDEEKRRSLAASPAYDYAVQDTHRAFQMIALVNPLSSSLGQEHEIDIAQTAALTAISSLQNAKLNDEHLDRKIGS